MPPTSSMGQIQDDKAVDKDVHPYTSELEAGTTFMIQVDTTETPLTDAVGATSSSTSSLSSSSRKVHFGGVKTRYYQHVLGDHPHCSDGLPLTFGWTYHDDDYCNGESSGVNNGINMGDWNCSQTISTNDTSNMAHDVPMGHITISFPSDSMSRKRAHVPKLTILARMSILVESGLSEEEIVKCVHKYHRNRRRTCRKDKRAKLWIGILQSFGFRY